MGIVDENRGIHQADSPAESLEQTIAAVEGIGRELNAVTSVMGDRARTLARKSAERSSAGEPSRSLEGVAFAIKDVIDVAGFPTTMGSKVSSGLDPSTSAPVVSLLERDGALPVVKTNCQEYSYGILGDESAFGRVVNPVEPALCTAGSSSGSAALVAAGVVPLALGTDTAGSVRVPAACQGVIGFKPTFGVVSTEGVFPLSPSFDTVGLFARDLSLLTTAFAAIAGDGRVADQRTERGADNGGQDDDGGGSVQTKQPLTVDLSLLESAGESAEGTRRWVDRALTEVRTTSARSEELSEVIERLSGIYDIVRRYEAYVLHQQFAEEQGELYQPGVWAKIMSGQTITEAEYQEQIVALEELRASAASIFDDVDFLLTPAIEGEVIRWDEIGPDSAARFMRYSMPFNVLGWPAVTLPIGASPQGTGAEETESARPEPARPESVQIVGRPHNDEGLLAFAARLSSAAGL